MGDGLQDRSDAQSVHRGRWGTGAGIEARTIDGVRVRVYSPAKTVADCFKYRNKIGLDVAVDALRRRRSVDELWKYAADLPRHV